MVKIASGRNYTKPEERTRRFYQKKRTCFYSEYLTRTQKTKKANLEIFFTLIENN